MPEYYRFSCYGPLGELEEVDGEIVEHHLEAQFGQELLDERRIEVLQEVGAEPARV
jgi:hypothetical protein